MTIPTAEVRGITSISCRFEPPDFPKKKDKAVTTEQSSENFFY